MTINAHSVHGIDFSLNFEKTEESEKLVRKMLFHIALNKSFSLFYMFFYTAETRAAFPVGQILYFIFSIKKELPGDC